MSADSGRKPPLARASPSASLPAAPASPPSSIASPTPPPTLAGVHYVVPPGWDLSTPAGGEAILTDQSGLTITLSAEPGTRPPVAATTGTQVAIDGSPGYEASGASRSPAGYDVHVGVLHSGIAYAVSCHGPDPNDSQTVHDVCDGFLQGLHWMTVP